MLPVSFTVVIMFVPFLSSQWKSLFSLRASKLCQMNKGIDEYNDDYSGQLSLRHFQQRREAYERKVAKGVLKRPPNPFLSPFDFVEELLRELRHPHHSQSGYLCLLESSTSEWRRILFGSVGASKTATNAAVAASLEELFQRQENQFGILVGASDEDYYLDFPSDFVDYGDGTGWVECRIRNQSNSDLLVVTGWSLQQRAADGAWQLDKLDWQDFREKYRPGIGREEWERICG